MSALSNRVSIWYAQVDHGTWRWDTRRVLPTVQGTVWWSQLLFLSCTQRWDRNHQRECVNSQTTSYPTQSCGELDGELRLVKENWYTNKCTICSCHPDDTSVNGEVRCEEATCDLHTCDLYARHRFVKVFCDEKLLVRFIKRKKLRDEIGHNCCQHECKNLQSNLPSIDFAKFYLFETDENGCTSLIGCSKRSYCTLRRDQSGCERCECEDEGEKAAVLCPVLKKCSKNCKYGQRWKMLFHKGRAL